MLPNGRFLLYVNDEIVPEDEVLAKLSENATLVACHANETSMTSCTSAWAEGQELWAVWHDAQQGILHLATTGDPPERLESFKNRYFAEQGEQKDVDYVFEIPIELFVAHGGIRYDQDIEGAAPELWQVLTRIKGSPTGARRKWRWFG